MTTLRIVSHIRAIQLVTTTPTDHQICIRDKRRGTIECTASGEVERVPNLSCPSPLRDSYRYPLKPNCQLYSAISGIIDRTHTFPRELSRTRQRQRHARRVHLRRPFRRYRGQLVERLAKKLRDAASRPNSTLKLACSDRNYCQERSLGYRFENSATDRLPWNEESIWSNDARRHIFPDRD